MRIEARLVSAGVLIVLALAPPVSALLTARLVTHILGQYLLLVVAGALVGSVLGRRTNTAWTAAPSFLVALFALGFWLLPRWIDTALIDPVAATAKAATLVLLAGIPLGWGWAQAGPILRSFVVANAAAMLLIMGWLQQAVPQRLCNAYLIGDQRALGLGMLLLAAWLVLSALLLVLPPRAAASRQPHPSQ